MPLPPAPRRPVRRAPLASALTVLIVAGAGGVWYWQSHRMPAEDLRVAFHLPAATPAAPAITYTLQNRGRRPATLQAVGLLQIAGNPPIINDSDNVDLCNKVDAAGLQPPGQATPQGTMLSQTGGAGGAAAEKRVQYAPVSVSVAGKAAGSGAPIAVAAGQSVAVTAGFKTDPGLGHGYDNQVFCPIVWLARPGPREAAVVCQGFAMATNNGGVSNTIVARQFQILPATAGAGCPVAPQR